MSLFTDGVDRLNTQVGKWASYLIYGMTGVVVYEVIARKVFSAPTSWAFDLTVYLGGAFFLLGFGYCLFLDNHVRVDVISAKFPPRLPGGWRSSASSFFSCPSPWAFSTPAWIMP